MTVIQHSATNVVERRAETGKVSTMIGAITLPGAALELMVCGDRVDLTLESTLEDEERELAAGNALVGNMAFAHIDLDGEHAVGLAMLLQQAIEVRALGLGASGLAQPQAPCSIRTIEK